MVTDFIDRVIHDKKVEYYMGSKALYSFIYLFFSLQNQIGMNLYAMQRIS